MFDDLNHKKNPYDEFVSSLSENEMRKHYEQDWIREELTTRKWGDPNNLQLCDWDKNRWGVDVKKKCPICGEPVYHDKWEPYYVNHMCYVCIKCNMEITFFQERCFSGTSGTAGVNNKYVEKKREEPVVYATKPLTARNNLYMTEGDVCEEKNYDKNGFYYLHLVG